MEEDEYNDIDTYIQDQKYPQDTNERVNRKVIMCNILILNFFHLIWKIYNSIGRNLVLKYCPRIIFYIKNNPPEKNIMVDKIKCYINRRKPPTCRKSYKDVSSTPRAGFNATR
jgi:hypothetical protein